MHTYMHYHVAMAMNVNLGSFGLLENILCFFSLFHSKAGLSPMRFATQYTEGNFLCKYQVIFILSISFYIVLWHPSDPPNRVDPSVMEWGQQHHAAIYVKFCQHSKVIHTMAAETSRTAEREQLHAIGEQWSNWSKMLTEFRQLSIGFCLYSFW